VVGNYGGIFTTAELTNNAPWMRRASRTFENLHKVVYLDGKLVAIGNRGTILQSGRFVTELEAPSFKAGNFQLPFKGVVNQAYQVEATTNFVNWTSIARFTNMTEHSVYTDTGASPFKRRFYRLKAE
jgi:hypothetical protein